MNKISVQRALALQHCGPLLDAVFTINAYANGKLVIQYSTQILAAALRITKTLRNKGDTVVIRINVEDKERT